LVADALLPGGAPAGAEEYRALLVAAVMAAPPLRLAELAPLAVRAADAGDEVAVALLDEAADLLTATLRALRPRPRELVVATGGLLVPAAHGSGAPDGPLTTRLAARLAALDVRVHWAADGLPGAVALARLASGAAHMPGFTGPR
jgi:N-acetylglucosamine kinase-like BadF-type ATPase